MLNILEKIIEYQLSIINQSIIYFDTLPRGAKKTREKYERV